MTTDMTTRLDAIRALLERRPDDGRKHYDGCEEEHIDCAAWELVGVAEVAQMAVENHACEWAPLRAVVAILNEEVPR